MGLESPSMKDPENGGFLSRLTRAAADGTRKSARTAVFLLKIMIPVSLVVALLGWSGILATASKAIAPLMRIIGLPGEAALAILSGALLSNYSAIAAMGSLSLSIREATIVSVMCLMAHNLIVETTVMRKAGSSAAKMAVLRVTSAIGTAFVLNLLLPRALGDIPFRKSAAALASRQEFWPMLGSWSLATGALVVKIFLIILVIMVVQKVLEEFRVMDFLSRIFAPLMKFLGLSRGASFLWIVINIVGYAYGAGITVAEVDSGRMKKQEADLFNHHAAISHSLLEDTIIFASMSLPVFWLLVPRLALSVAVVWGERFRRHYLKRSFRVGTV